MMDKLQIYICENIYPEYKKTVKDEGFVEIDLITFPAICVEKKKKEEIKSIFQDAPEGSVLICNKTCKVIELINDNEKLELIETKYCQSTLTCDEFLDYLIRNGSYVLTTSWLRSWKQHLKTMGFNNSLAKQFFNETCKQLVFLDSKLDIHAEKDLKELSSYIDLPYLIIPIELDQIKMMLKSKLFEWKIKKASKNNQKTINELQSKCAEFSAVFDMLGRISSFRSKRDIIGKVKELFLIVLGAQEFNFWDINAKNKPKEIKSLLESAEKYVTFKDQNRFCIKIEWNNILYGVLDVSDFVFPKYIDRYLNLAIEISNFCGLVLQNNEQYQQIVKSERELKYLSYHDSMTGLNNRTFINEMLDKQASDESIVFMFDIDSLKYVNDNYGHSYGDDLIKRFAEVLKSNFRDEDIVARIGGDEFLAIIHNYDEESAKLLKNRINEAIEEDNSKNSKGSVFLNASIGYAKKEKQNETYDLLMRKADEKMYEEKLSKKKFI